MKKRIKIENSLKADDACLRVSCHDEEEGANAYVCCALFLKHFHKPDMLKSSID